MDFMTPEGGAGLGVLYLLRAMGMTVLAGLFLCAFLTPGWTAGAPA